MRTIRHFPPRSPDHKPWRQRNGSTRAWRKLRALVLERDNYTCRNCGRLATQADHIRPGGPDVLENLQALCARCNQAKGG